MNPILSFKRLVAAIIVLFALFCEAINPLQVRRQALANALVNRTVITGVKSILFARDGSGGTTSASAKPAADAVVYESLGRVEKATVSNKVEDIRIRNASTGVYGDELTIPMSQELMFEFTMQNINQILVEALYLASGAITVATPLQPMAQTAKIKGWLQVLRYDQTSASTITDVAWVELTVGKRDDAEKSYSLELSARVLKNTLNTVNIVALVAL